ncbi:sperm acrosome-associated protein 5 [Macaca nemestrina]|uniref:Lysozyme E n=11 Tax=Cercopithecinae TaxID=9528 RepID=F7FWH5_MACMU|nr:sperm acrosome-associated protein 5 [Macaca fascicularis]XP_007989742.1 sperm acrosome-associated protein 5 [Chlorocebus sabaeus]XP_009195772.1 sperm acrosome-associated protein 5 [Papio anubis]XP_011709959.1 sperm acrosome-associated protein 5 [Macaca nemestrina]XP_011838256.1 PREDICTED: sperm acrosome-associated protein 5 [Mandrillus leucophaeus]XP_011925525.1 PREDICTED: sperm acrosome-associated protein 5 isoform X1 [Cercocebus atys]XP_011925526.1 PREDICTED: sperm acrosome-associated pr
MQAWGTVVVTLATLMVVTVDAKIYERCELAARLERAGLNGYKGYGIGDWLCMAHYESGFDTAFVDHNPDGSSEYGIFQLNSAWWCDNGITPTKNLCHMDCHDLLNRHILDDIMCAKQIVSSQNGLSAWTSWRRHCSGHDLSEWLKGCDMNVKIDPKIHP